MEIVRVQRWVMSAVLAVTATIFAGGLVTLGATMPDRNGSRVGLLVLSAVVGVLAVLGVRALNATRWATPWLVAGLLPAALGYALLYPH